MTDFPEPSFDRQRPLTPPGRDADMNPRPDCAKAHYRGSGRPSGHHHGADRGIGRAIVETAANAFGQLDVLVNNAAHQKTFANLEEISDDEWEVTFATNIHAMFYLVKDALPHLKAGSAIINTTSVNADAPSPRLLAYATTKGAIQNFTGGLAQMLAEREIWVTWVTWVTWVAPARFGRR